MFLIVTWAGAPPRSLPPGSPRTVTCFVTVCQLTALPPTTLPDSEHVKLEPQGPHLQNARLEITLLPAPWDTDVLTIEHEREVGEVGTSMLISGVHEDQRYPWPITATFSLLWVQAASNAASSAWEESPTPPWWPPSCASLESPCSAAVGMWLSQAPWRF